MRTGSKPWKGFVTDTAPSLSTADLEALAGKRVFITGAGGFIGSALARRLARIAVQELVLLDSAEYGLYRLEQSLTRRTLLPPAAIVVGSVCDDRLLEEIFARHEPHLVFHAAALKHVPLMETNSIAAVETNVLGTESVVRAAGKRGAERVILLSSDKAVDPVSVMGATKRLAELVTLKAGLDQEAATGFTALRLCNVLGSTGSVAPLFARQIAAGGPVTVTDPAATRFFLSSQDAVRWLLLAALRERKSGLVIPAVGPARSIVDLAMFLIKGAEREANSPAMTYTGLRSADKLHETLHADRETPRGGFEERGLLALDSPSPPPLALQSVLDDLRAAVRDRDQSRLMAALQRGVPEYVPASQCRGVMSPGLVAR